MGPILYSEFFDALYLQDWRNGPRGLLNEENHFFTAASGSKSTSDVPSSEIPIRSSRVYPPREERESFLILFCSGDALSQPNCGDRKNQEDINQVESIFEIIFVRFLC